MTLAVTAMLLAVVLTATSAAAVRPSSAERLLTYLWTYGHGSLRPYVSSVSITGATANVRLTMHDDRKLTNAFRHVCEIAAAGVRTLRLRTTISTVQTWSVEGHPVARC